MSNTIPLGILVNTYIGKPERFQYAQATIEALARWLRYSLGPVHVHIADDGSDSHYVQSLRDCAITAFASNHNIQYARCTVSVTDREGYGGSYNAATNMLHDDNPFILAIEDDWELLRELPLDKIVQAVGSSDEYNSCRLGYIGFTQALRGEFRYLADEMYLLLDEASPEPHVFSGHPRLEKRDYQRRVGLWPKWLNAGATEFMVSQRQAAREGVLWPAWLVHPVGDLFGHIGTISVKADTFGE